MLGLGLRLTPHGRLVVEERDDAPEIDAAALTRLTEAFARGTGYGLVHLGAAEVGHALPPVFVWWRGFAARYVGSLRLHTAGMDAEDTRQLPTVPAPTAARPEPEFAASHPPPRDLPVATRDQRSLGARSSRVPAQIK